MNSPIYDFLVNYAEKNATRMHMPGHKGMGPIGCESYDITEVKGADVLYSADGIILESENNATELFGSYHTFYSAEGSTLSIKAMLALATRGIKKPVILATRNAHKAFIYGCALIDIEVRWLYPKEYGHLCSCKISADEVEAAIDDGVSAVYLTSPDYLGNIQDVKAISEVCHRHGIPLLVDNAHGAYLKFLNPSMHPIDLGADMCCDSAHKTLPVLTGGGYLHVMNESYCKAARGALSLFASTSPSYLTLGSLDLCNKYIADGYREKLTDFVGEVNNFKAQLNSLGYETVGEEPLKITVNAASYGYTGTELCEILRENNIEPEFSDREFLVLMLTPEVKKEDLERTLALFKSIERKTPIKTEVFTPLCYEKPKTSIRNAIFSNSKTLPLSEALGKITASPTVSCPPAIPIAVSGEVITEERIRMFSYYGIDTVDVIDE